MKQPKGYVFTDEKHIAQFINECDVWINLGMHPNIVSCYYVREIDGIPSIFSEWMDGGSLKDWIYGKNESKDLNMTKKTIPGRLYDGGTKVALKRILDIAIQSARGLHYAHKNKIIHQDVKPANLLMTSDGVAKIADFGISSARSKLGRSIFPDDEYIIPKVSGTNEYRSPEQLDLHPLTPQTDVWSWAVSVLEMFRGNKAWTEGVAAGFFCEQYFHDTLIPIPDEVKKLLRNCFRMGDKKQLMNFAEIETCLSEIYLSMTGDFYPRPKARAVVDTADILNNRALSYLDIGMTGEAEECWEKAIKKQPDHLDSIFNKTVYLWRSGQIDDLQAADRLKDVYENNPDNRDAVWLYANLCLERFDYRTAIQLLNDRKETFSDKTQSSFFHLLKSMEDRQTTWQVLSDRIEYTGLLHIDGNGRSIISSSKKGFEKWDIEYSTKNVPTNIKPAGKYEWNWEQTKVFRFSDDGQYALTLEGRKDGEGRIVNGKAVCLWTVDGCRCIHRFVSPRFLSNQPKEACFLNNNRHVLTVAWDDGAADCAGELKVWETGSGKCIQTVSIDEKNISTVAITPDSLSLLTASRNGHIKLFDSRTGKLRQTFHEINKLKHLRQLFKEDDLLYSEDEELQCSIQTMSLTPDDKLAVAYTNGLFGLWNIVDGNLIYLRKSSVGKGLYFFPDGQHLFSVSSGCRLIDLASGVCINTSTDRIPDANILYLNSKYALTTAEIDCENRRKELILISLPDFDRQQNVRWALSRIVNIEELKTRELRFRQIAADVKTCVQKKEIETALKYIDKIFDIPSVSRNTRHKLNDETGKYCRIKGLRSITQERSVEKKTFGHYTFSSEGYLIADGTLYDVVNNKYLHDFKEFPVLYAFSHDNRLVYGFTEVSKYLQPIKVFETQTGNCLSTFKSAHSDTVNTLLISRNGKHLLSGSDDGTAKLWDVKRSNCTHVFVHEQEVKSACFGPDMKTVVTLAAPSGCRPGEIFQWDIHGGEKRLIRDNVYSIAPNHSNTRLLTGMTGRVELIDLHTGKTLATCRHRNNPKYCPADLKFFPDERYALSTGLPGSICYWNLDEEKHLRSLRNPGLHLAIHPSGNYALAYATACYLIRFDHLYEFPGWAEWDEGARPFLENFLTTYPEWTETNLKEILIPELQARGYGWIVPEGIDIQLKKMKLQTKS
jgi:WD40 repeat protein